MDLFSQKPNLYEKKVDNYLMIVYSLVIGTVMCWSLMMTKKTGLCHKGQCHSTKWFLYQKDIVNKLQVIFSCVQNRNSILYCCWLCNMFNVCHLLSQQHEGHCSLILCTHESHQFSLILGITFLVLFFFFMDKSPRFVQ